MNLGQDSGINPASKCEPPGQLEKWISPWLPLLLAATIVVSDGCGVTCSLFMGSLEPST